MSDYEELGRIIDRVLKESWKEELTLWIVEEETGEAVKLYDMLNAEKHSEDGVFKRIK